MRIACALLLIGVSAFVLIEPAIVRVALNNGQRGGRDLRGARSGLHRAGRITAGIPIKNFHSFEGSGPTLKHRRISRNIYTHTMCIGISHETDPQAER
jgi:hypothetical protein